MIRKAEALSGDQASFLTKPAIVIKIVKESHRRDSLERDTNMLMEMLKSKLHRACITDGNVHYEGSLGIDIELMEMVGLVPYEKILVSNINNGQRFETYAIAEPFGSRKIVLNGAAARLGAVQDRIIIMSFCQVESKLVHEGKHRPQVIRLDENNEPVTSKTTSVTQDEIISMLEG